MSNGITLDEIMSAQQMTAPTSIQFRVHVPTPEEEVIFREEMSRHDLIDRTVKRLVREQRLQPDKWHTLDCPACGGELKFGYSGYNGHFHVHCATDGCASWME